jgi:hypothetical protein
MSNTTEPKVLNYSDFTAAAAIQRSLEDFGKSLEFSHTKEYSKFMLSALANLKVKLI